MKVLNKGSGQKGWSTKVHCSGNGNGDGGCGAFLMVEQSDLYHTDHYDYSGGHDTFVTFTCCECGVETDVEGAYHLDLPSRSEWIKKWSK